MVVVVVEMMMIICNTFTTAQDKKFLTYPRLNYIANYSCAYAKLYLTVGL